MRTDAELNALVDDTIGTDRISWVQALRLICGLTK